MGELYRRRRRVLASWSGEADRLALASEQGLLLVSSDVEDVAAPLSLFGVLGNRHLNNIR